MESGALVVHCLIAHARIKHCKFNNSKMSNQLSATFMCIVVTGMLRRKKRKGDMASTVSVVIEDRLRTGGGACVSLLLIRFVSFLTNSDLKRVAFLSHQSLTVVVRENTCFDAPFCFCFLE